ASSPSRSADERRPQEKREPAITRAGASLTVEFPEVKVRLNCRRGLAVEGLWFMDVSDRPLCGTLPHGYFDDIKWGADYYTGHTILQAPGRPQITDLNPIDPSVRITDGTVVVAADIATPL